MAKLPLLRPHILMATIAALSLSACFGSPDVMKRSDTQRPSADTPKRPQMTSAPSFNSPEARQCAVDLQQAGVKFTPLPNQDHGGGCSSIDAVKLLDIGTPTTNLGAMTCPLARNFAAWAQYAVKPAARKYFGREVVKIETFGTYSCRNIYGGRSAGCRSMPIRTRSTCRASCSPTGGGSCSTAGGRATNRRRSSSARCTNRRAGASARCSARIITPPIITISTWI
jgi:hypothetical protein